MADYWNPTVLPKNNQSFGADQNMMIPQFQTPFNFQQQYGQNEALVSGYAGAIAGQERLPAMRSRLEGQYFIPQLREQVQTGQQALAGLGAQIKAMPQQVAATTRDSMVTEGQRSGMVQSKQKPLLEAYGTMGTNLGQAQQMLSGAEQNLNTAMQYEIAQQKKDLEPWEWKYDLNNIMQAREFTGWSQANEMELRRLQQNQQAGVQITEAEKNRKQELEMLKQRYALELENYGKQMEIAAKYSPSADMWGDW